VTGHACRQITYYVSPDRFVAHASGRGAVFIPPLTPDPGRTDRVRITRPLWLTESLADVVALTAANRAGIKEGDVFDLGGLAGVDKTAMSV
jgi:hypothetical protein